MARPQPKTITFEIDGREVEAAEGTMLVDAAKNGDVEIPYFCYEPKLGQPVGACRMCLVEIEGIPKLQTSCSTPVRDGMIVNTTSDRVKKAQNAVVEFLLVNHPLDCPVCDKGGECPLQDIAYGWGPGKSRFIEPKRHFRKPLELSPLVAIDRERCILCYRCVRFSQEVAEDHQLVFLERGDHTYVGTHDGRPYVGPFSGNIIELCPVGALTSSAYRFRARPWDVEGAGSVCTLCPAQCNVEFTVRDDSKVLRVLARDNEEVDDGWVCDKGRFGYQAIHSPDRIHKPMVRDGGYLREVSWERALTEAASALGKAGAKAAAIAGGATTNEEGFLLQHLFRKGLKSPHLNSRPSGLVDGDAARTLARPDLSARVSDIDHADAIVLVDCEPVDEAASIDLRIRKAVRRNGAKLVTLTSRPGTLEPNATVGVRFAPGAGEAALGALAAELGSDRIEGSRLTARASIEPGAIAEAAAALEGAQDIVVVWSESLAGGERGADTIDALLALAAQLGIADAPEAGMLSIPAATNGRGLYEVGVAPNLGPGLVDAPEAGLCATSVAHGLRAGDLTTLMLLNVDPLVTFPNRPHWQAAIDSTSQLIAFADFLTPTLEEKATVVFPAESGAEKDGTLTHFDGRLQRVRQAIGHQGEVRGGWDVLSELAARCGAGVDAISSAQVTELVSKAVGFYSGITLEEIGGKGVRWQDRDAASKLQAPELPEGQLAQPPELPDGLLLGAVRSIWADPITEHAPSLRFLNPEQRAELSVSDAKRLGVSSGDRLEVAVGDHRVEATAAVRQAVAPGSMFLFVGTTEDNANELTDGSVRAVQVTKLADGPLHVQLAGAAGAGPQAEAPAS